MKGTAKKDLVTGLSHGAPVNLALFCAGEKNEESGNVALKAPLCIWGLLYDRMEGEYLRNLTPFSCCRLLY